jgi:hypothetical protein
MRSAAATKAQTHRAKRLTSILSAYPSFALRNMM